MINLYNLLQRLIFYPNNIYFYPLRLLLQQH
nr:MAG TPA: hypothetical protein [Caudoviricetes sp.]